MREQTFQRLLKPHSFPLSWRDKKGAPGGIPSRKSRQGFRPNPSGLRLGLLRPAESAAPGQGQQQACQRAGEDGGGEADIVPGFGGLGALGRQAPAQLWPVSPALIFPQEV